MGAGWLAGHPTIATTVALLDAGRLTLRDGQVNFTLEVGAGVVEITVEAADAGPALVTMRQLRPVFGRSWYPEEIAPLVGLEPGDLAARPQTVSTGTPYVITQVHSHEVLRRARLDVEVRGPRDDIQAVLVGGTGAVVMRGEIELP